MLQKLKNILSTQKEVAYYFPNPIAQKISIVIPTHNNAETLPHTLDSVLMQCPHVDLEVIVVDDASTDNTPVILQDYIKTYPHHVRTMRFSENKGAGHARNIGLTMARGEFVTFVDADDCLDAHFLQRGLEVITEEVADIVTFDTVTIFQRTKKKTRWGVNFGVYGKQSSLEQLLLMNLGNTAAYAHLYRVKMLCENNVFFTPTKHEDMFFTLKAFFFSKKTVVLDKVGYYRNYYYLNSTSSNHTGRAQAFCAYIESITNFFETYNLDINGAMYEKILSTLYQWDRMAVLQATLSNTDIYAQTLALEQIQNIGVSAFILKNFLEDFARLTYRLRKSPIVVDPRYIDWHKESKFNYPKALPIAYANADSPTIDAPILTVVVPSFNSEDTIKPCLDAILEQASENIEVIVIDDASTDTSYDILCSYADRKSAIRLYRMKENCRQSNCRNHGLQKARGKYIIFVDSDDIVKPTFFADAISDIEEHNADIIMYSVEHYYNGSLFYNKILEDAIYTSKNLILEYLRGNIVGEVFSKIYSLKFLRNNDIAFSPYLYFEDVHFLLDCFHATKLCISKSSIQYTRIKLETSSVMPVYRRWLRLHSACVLYNRIQEEFNNMIQNNNEYGTTVKEVKEHIVHNEFISWNIKNCFILDCAAYLHEIGEIPFTSEDMKCLQNSPVFISNMLSCFAKLLESQRMNSALLANKIIHTELPFKGENIIPLVSVIVSVYNQELTLTRCLDSILSQPFQNFEIILVNDASSDCTAFVCEDFAKKDTRIQIFTNEYNLGIGQSRNLALQKAQGKYITYVDSDDTINNSLLLHGITLLENNDKVDFVTFNVREEITDGELIQHNNEQTGIQPGLICFEKICNNSIGFDGVWGKIYRKNFIVDNAVQFKKYMFGDILFLLQTYYQAKNIYFTGINGYTRLNKRSFTSATPPMGKTSKHVSDILQLTADVNIFFSSLPPEHVQEYCENFFENFSQIWKCFKNYVWHVSELYELGVLPFSTSVLESIAPVKKFFQHIVEEYARLYAQKINYRALPPDDTCNTSPLYPKTQANHLVTFVDKAEPNEDIEISVIVPAYNVATTVGKCLDSILVQKVDLEIIVVEDCSVKDNTFACCLEYAQKYPQIRLFQSPWNSGLGVARTLGQEKARGKYVTFVDSDDWLEPTFLQNALRALRTHSDAQVYVCNVRRIFNDRIEYTTYPDAIVSGKEMIEPFFNWQYKHVASWSTVYDRKFLENNNLEHGKDCYVDETIMPNVYMCANKVILNSEIGYNYNLYDGFESIMRPTVRGKRYFDASIYNIKTTFELLERFPIIDGDLQKNRLSRFFRGHHQANIFLYIHACNVFNRPSPLTSDVMDILTKNTVFINILLCEYSKLIVQIENDKKNFSIKESKNGSNNTFIPIQLSLYEKYAALLRNVFLRKTPKNIVDIISIYEQNDYEFAKKTIANARTSPRIRANAYTSLAKYIEMFSKKQAAELAHIAYTIDPKAYRLKFLAIKYYHINNYKLSYEIFKVLPSNMRFSIGETKILDKLKKICNNLSD